MLFVFVCGVEKKGRGIYTLVLLFGKEKESLDRRRSPVAKARERDADESFVLVLVSLLYFVL